MKKTNVTRLCQSAAIAAIYLVLTFIANAFGLANYAIQVRFSESLTILPYFSSVAIPGLFVGCLLSNILTGCALPDIIFGSIATLIGAIGTRCLSKKNKWLAPVPAILSNTIIVPFILKYCYGIEPIWYSFLTVGIGEIISCGILGMLLLFAFEKRRNQIFKEG